MLSDLMQSMEPHLWLLSLVYVVISLLFAIILTKYISKRYVKNGGEIDAEDKARLQEIADRSMIFKLFFQFSLHKNNRVTGVFFIFLFNIAVPFIGYVLSLWITWYLNNITYEKKVINTNILNLDEFGIAFLKVERIFGEGSMLKLLADNAPKSKKLKALSALASSVSPVNLRIIKQTLSSTDDEIRMFGYAIINKMEKTVNDKINKYINIFNKESEKKIPNMARRAKAANELAFLYWEMIYTELSHESLRENFIKEVIKYLNIAKEYYVKVIKKHHEITHEDVKYFDEYSEIYTKLYVLGGRVYMYEKNYDMAMIEFTTARELDPINTAYVLPYLAEIYYLNGNYKRVNSIMNEASQLAFDATLYPIIEQWKIAK